jgi:uncharacterized delta-60 repeat protein
LGKEEKEKETMEKRILILFVLMIATLCLRITGCSDEDAKPTFASPDGDSDVDSDSDVDTDTDTYTNTGGDLIWAKQAGGYDQDISNGIAALADGSSLITGSFEETAGFGMGEANETELVTGVYADIFIAKYNSDGSLAWAKRAGGGLSRGCGIAALADGSSLTTGSFNGPAVFGEGEANETELTADSGDIFVAKYNPDGSLAWVKQAGGSGTDRGYGIAALADGSALITGMQSPLIAKYNPDGSLAWAKQTGGNGHDEGRGIAALADGSSLITGCFGDASSDTVVFGEGEANETQLDSTGYEDVFIAKYNADGSLAWAKRAGGDDTDEGFGITALADGASLMTGFFLGTAMFGEGEANETELTADSGDIFVAKYNPDGSLAWVKQAGGSGTDKGLGIAALADGSSLITGSFKQTAVFGEGEANETELDTGVSNTTFIAKYNPDGSLAWAKQTGGGGGLGITILADGASLLITGSFGGTAVFGEGETNETELPGLPGVSADIFIAKYSVE